MSQLDDSAEVFESERILRVEILNEFCRELWNDHLVQHHRRLSHLTGQSLRNSLSHTHTHTSSLFSLALDRPHDENASLLSGFLYFYGDHVKPGIPINRITRNLHELGAEEAIEYRAGISFTLLLR